MRVLTIRESTWLNVMPGAAWRRILSLEEWSDWHDDLARAHWVGRSGWRPGHRFRLVPSGLFPRGLFPRGLFPRGQGLPFLAGGPPITGGVITQVETDRAVHWVERLLTMRVEHALIVTTEGLGTRVEYATTVRGLAVRVIGQESVVRALTRSQRGFLASLRAAGERVRSD